MRRFILVLLVLTLHVGMAAGQARTIMQPFNDAARAVERHTVQDAGRASGGGARHIADDVAVNTARTTERDAGRKVAETTAADARALLSKQGTEEATRRVAQEQSNRIAQQNARQAVSLERQATQRAQSKALEERAAADRAATQQRQFADAKAQEQRVALQKFEEVKAAELARRTEVTRTAAIQQQEVSVAATKKAEQDTAQQVNQSRLAREEQQRIAKIKADEVAAAEGKRLDELTLLNKSLASKSQMVEAGSAVAGKNAAKELWDTPRIAKQYGGSSADWTKKSSSVYAARDGSKFETHWIENAHTGERIEYKTILIKGY